MFRVTLGNQPHACQLVRQLRIQFGHPTRRIGGDGVSSQLSGQQLFHAELHRLGVAPRHLAQPNRHPFAIRPHEQNSPLSTRIA
ncbi:MAG: hypothetical protein SGJ19_00655 [Planctomycetia bacterium]|nr:hypothetical protein [Planctomycetia bacterium]